MPIRRLRPARGVQHLQRPSRDRAQPLPAARSRTLDAGSGRVDIRRGTAGAALGSTAAQGGAAHPIRLEHAAWACFGIFAALSVAIWWPWPLRLLLVLVEVSQ